MSHWVTHSLLALAVAFALMTVSGSICRLRTLLRLVAIGTFVFAMALLASH